MTAQDSQSNSPNGAVADIPLKPENAFVKYAKSCRVPILILGHMLIFCLVYWIALVVRFEKWFPDHNPNLFWFGLPYMATTKLAVFYAMKNFHGWWRHVTFSDMVSVVRAAVISAGVVLLIDYLFIPFQISKGVILIDCIFTIAALSVLRSAWRFWDENVSNGFKRNNKKRKRALLIGSDIDSAKLAHLINSRSSLDFKVVGLVSTTKMKPLRFSDLRVVGSTDDIVNLCQLFRAQTVYVPSGQLQGKKLRSLIDEASRIDVDINVVPKLSDFLAGGDQIPIREVRFEDLLRRPPAQLNLEAIRKLVENKTVLVTGAGGSIGSELCRQLVKFGPAKLMLLGRGENRIYHIQRELAILGNRTELIPCLATITDRKRISQVMKKYQPDVIFHAAAHKHVPLTESNVGEAVINNVHGTRVMADLAHENNVGEFVLVSTDKAVNPTSVMGCTKQIAERYCLALGSVSETKFVVTRFGNVLGSAGSVVPLFKEQIQKGGPITITDERMTRFFMTIPEAAQLVIQAATMGTGGEIFVLEMGEPVLIKDLAKDLIRLAGLPPDSIDIVYTGIRKGEKLYEELYYIDERSLPTEHEKILTAYHRPFGYQETALEIDRLVESAYHEAEYVREKLASMIPEFDKPETTESKKRVAHD